MTVIPIHQLQSRIREQGRIRMGQKNARGFPQKLKRFRFTSADKPAIEAIANLYGGTCRSWAGAPTEEQYEVTIEADRVPIILPPNPLGDSPVYELWSGGGCARRCDGVECVIPTQPDPIPCMCAAKQEMVCKATTRLNVVMREIPFGGVWRLESHGWNTALEMPGQVEMILGLQQHGLVKGLLTMEERVAVKEGKTSKYNVPALVLDETLEALASGAANVRALGEARPPHLELPPPSETPPVPVEPSLLPPGGRTAPHLAIPAPTADDVEDDDDIADAELVDEDPAEVAARQARLNRLSDVTRGIADFLTIGTWPSNEDGFHRAFALALSKGTKNSLDLLTHEELGKGLTALADLLDGSRGLLTPPVDDTGKLRVSRKRS